ncbi:MAG: hypothetical protein ACTSRZ_08035 [Promethearchaeota archaeon]
MPRLVLVINGQKISREKSIALIIAIIFSSAILVVFGYFFIKNEQVGDFSKSQLLVILALIPFGIGIAIYLFKKYNLFAKLKSMLKSPKEFKKGIEKIKKTKRSIDELELQKKIKQAQRKLEKAKSKIPFRELKKAFKSKSAKEIKETGKKLIESKELGKEFKKGIEKAKEIGKKATEKIKEIISYDEFEEFPEPEELINRLSNEDHELAYKNEIPAESSMNEAELYYHLTEPTEEMLIIHPPKKAPLEKVPQINFIGNVTSLNNKHKSGLLLILLVAVFLFGILFYIFR